MVDTTEKILDGARQCFFQHGFTKATMSMIAQYSGCSRVTLYKYFKTKEDIFLRICLDFLDEHAREVEELLGQNLGFWKNLEGVITSHIVSPFERVGNDIISADLMAASNTVSDEVFLVNDRQIGATLQRIIEEAVARGEISIAQFGAEPADLAEMIKLMMYGLTKLKIDDIRAQAQRMVELLRRGLSQTAGLD